MEAFHDRIECRAHFKIIVAPHCNHASQLLEQMGREGVEIGEVEPVHGLSHHNQIH